MDEIRIENGLIYILDKQMSKSLFVFDKNGKFIRKIGKLGKGTGEYINPRSFDPDRVNQQVNILDSKKILIFSLDGKFVRNIDLNADNTYQIANNKGTVRK